MTANPRRVGRNLITALVVVSSLVIMTACAADRSPEKSGTSAISTLKTGGTLNAGIVGGSAKDTLDAHSPVTHPDIARIIQLYSGLATHDAESKVEMDLADTITPSSDAKTWTVHLRDGLKFSDGRPITSEDVIFTFRRITDPKNPQTMGEALKNLNRDGMKATDAQTVVFPFKSPFASFPDTVAEYNTGIVPVGYDPMKPIGSGPFMFESFTPGQQSTFVKNPNYWRTGQPYLDKLTLIDFPDDAARVNALLGGQVDVIDQLPLGQINVVKSNPLLKVLDSPAGGWIPFTMRVDQAPFDNPKVREAFRLIVDRQQMVEQVLGGHGELGNDMYGRFDNCYPKDIPQRSQDIAKAKQLLAEAGKSNLSVDLVTSPVAAGMVEAAQVFAQQAKAAGVTINVKKVDPGEFFGDMYLKRNFSQDFWFGDNYLVQTSWSSFRTSPFNETHWDDQAWSAVVNKANATTDQAKQCPLIQKAQQIEYDRGGYIIWGFPNSVDAYAAKVHGFTPGKTFIPLNFFAFRNVWISD